MKKLLSLLMILLCLDVSAQITTSSLRGVVTDSAKRPLAGAAVLLQQPKTGVEYYAIVNRDGRYSMHGIKPDEGYVLLVEFIGYEPYKATNVALRLGETRSEDVELRESAVSLDEVVVSAQSVKSAGVTENFDKAQIEMMPTVSRSLYDVVRLMPQANAVRGGGMSFGTNPEAAAEVTRAVRKVTNKPIIIKLSPNVTDIVSIAKACEEAGADGISLINTLLGMRIDLRTKRPVIANKMGGFSGPAIFPVAVRMVYQVANAVNIPVVGMGGVSSAEDVIEMMLAGATAVEVGAANLVNPYACRDIIADLPRAMEKYGIENLADIIGAVK